MFYFLKINQLPTEGYPMKFPLFSLMMLVFISPAFAGFDEDGEAFKTVQMRVTRWDATTDTRKWVEIENADANLSFIRLFASFEPHPLSSVEDVSGVIQHQQDVLTRKRIENLLRGDFTPTLPCPCLLAVREGETDELMGYIKMKTTSTKDIITFAWALASQWRGHGFGSELLAGLLDYLTPFMCMEPPLIQGVIADVEITNPASLSVLYKWMQPYNMTDVCLGPMCFTVVQFRYPLQRFTTPLPILTGLTSKDRGERQRAIQEIRAQDAFKDKWNPFYDRLLIETFYQHYLLNRLASQRGLPWK